MKRTNVELSEMLFRDEQHRDMYVNILHQMKSNTPEHAALAYLLALIKAPVNCCFDFSNDKVKLNAVEGSWVTGSCRRVLALAFNLWNFQNPADVSDVFSYCAYEYGDYLFYAIQMRFEVVNYHRLK